MLTIAGTGSSTGAGSPAWSIARPDGTERTLIATAVARWELAPGPQLSDANLARPAR